MPFLLVKISKARWLVPSTFKWLPEGAIQSDPMYDLRTTDNAISTWEIDDAGENLKAVLAGLAANRDHLANLDYAVFEQRFAQDISIKVQESQGNTKSSKANNFHRDLVN